MTAGSPLQGAAEKIRTNEISYASATEKVDFGATVIFPSLKYSVAPPSCRFIKAGEAIIQMLAKRLNNQLGASMTELSLVMSLIAMVCIPSTFYLGRAANDRFVCLEFESDTDMQNLSVLISQQNSELPPLPGSCVAEGDIQPLQCAQLDINGQCTGGYSGGNIP